MHDSAKICANGVICIYVRKCQIMHLYARMTLLTSIIFEFSLKIYSIYTACNLGENMYIHKNPGPIHNISETRKPVSFIGFKE